jgi:uncharacterized membrane protein
MIWIVGGLLMSIHRGVRNHLWYWAIMIAVAFSLALIFGASIGVILLGVVFVTFLLMVAMLFGSLWVDMKRRGEIDRYLSRASEICNVDLIEETDAELEHVLPLLVAAGFVVLDGKSPTGYRFTPEGVSRRRALGLL